MHSHPHDRIGLAPGPRSRACAALLFAAFGSGLLGAFGASPCPADGPAVANGVAVYDPVRDRMILWENAYHHIGSWTKPLPGTAAWSPLVPGGSTLFSSGAAYDPQRDRVLYFSGMTSSYRWSSELYALALDGSGWSFLGTGPMQVGAFPQVAVDSAHDRMLAVFVGYAEYEVWQCTLSGTPSWSRITSMPIPGPINGFVAAHDASRDRVLIILGDTKSTSTVWEVSLATRQWSPLVSGGPAPFTHVLNDPAHDRMFLMDGPDWVWCFWLDSGTWQQVFAAPPSPARQNVAALYDPVRDRIVIHGGWDYSDPEYPVALAETWALRLSGFPAWQRIDGPLLDVDPDPVSAIALSPVVPNPTRGECRFDFTLPREMDARLTVLDVSGRVVATLAEARFPAGRHSSRWNGRTAAGLAPAGIYLLRLAAGGEVRDRRLALVP